MKHKNLENRLVEFASSIVELTTSFNKSDFSRIISNQILRSGTSVALNYGEALSAESRKDFIHKMRVSLKELRETNIALKIIRNSNNSPKIKLITNLLGESNELISIFVTSINTAVKNLNS